MSAVSEDAIRATLASQRNDALDCVAHLNGVVADLHAELETYKRETLSEKNARIAELEQTLREKDEQIEEQSKTIVALRPAS